MYLTIEDGKKIAMPRYYKEKIYTHMERSEIAGYQKGEIEKRTIEETQRILLTEGGLEKHLHDAREAIAASVIRMEKSSLKTKI